MVADGGPPRCRGCDAPLRFDTDRNGRTTESCGCGYRGYTATREGLVAVPPGGHAAGMPAAARRGA